MDQFPRLLRRSQVEAAARLRRSSIRALMTRGQFQRPMCLAKPEMTTSQASGSANVLVSGPATVGAPPRGSSGQLGQLKSPATIEGFRNYLGCDQAPVLSINGAAVDRGGEL